MTFFPHRRRALHLATAAMAGLITTGARTMTADTTTNAIPADVATLLKIMQDTWNASDMDAMFAMATPDIHWVNVVGMHWQGLAAVKKAHAVFFDIMFRGVHLKLEAVESVKTLPGGVTIIVVHWLLGAYVTPGGERRPPSGNRMSIIAIPTAEGLRISHVANIEIVEQAQAHNPIK